MNSNQPARGWSHSIEILIKSTPFIKCVQMSTCVLMVPYLCFCIEPMKWTNWSSLPFDFLHISALRSAPSMLLWQSGDKSSQISMHIVNVVLTGVQENLQTSAVYHIGQSRHWKHTHIHILSWVLSGEMSLDVADIMHLACHSDAAHTVK